MQQFMKYAQREDQLVFTESEIASILPQVLNINFVLSVISSNLYLAHPPL